MYKTLLSISLAGVMSIMISGCSSSEPIVEEVVQFDCLVENILAPKWTCIPTAKNAYAGIGIAQKSAAGMAHMRRVALANGRSDLAQQIQTQVKDKVEIFTRSTGVTQSETIDKVNTAVSKQVAKVDLYGSKAINSWNAPSGALYLLVAVDQKNVNTAVKESIKSSYKNDDALWQQFQSQQSLKSLDEEFPTD
ncbi:MAG: LPP20 family lipoprotein [Campylobacterota bacterium]|nr:LPP20 family lipoprotein [Campylobacterota bacterium]